MSVIEDVYAVIQTRKKEVLEGSYTNYLLSEGRDKICKKIGEEATEIVIASKNENEKELILEVSDLVYHLLVLLAYENISPAAIEAELQRRTAHIAQRKVTYPKGAL